MDIVVIVVPVLASIVTVIFWMVVGWRAMRAHEDLSYETQRIAKSIQEISQSLRKMSDKP